MEERERERGGEAPHLGAFADEAFVAGHDPVAVEGFDAIGAQQHVDVFAGEADGHRVEALADADPGLLVDPRAKREAGIERLDGQRHHRVGLEREMVADGDRPPGNAPAVIDEVTASDEVVELGHRGHAGHRDEVAAAEPADLALDAALLVRAFDAGPAEERVEPVVRAQHDESFGLETITALEYPHHRRLQVVIADPCRHPTEVFERADVAIDEGLLGLVAIHPVERLARRRETYHEHPPVGEHPVEVERDLTEIDLALIAEAMKLRDHHLDHRRGLRRFPVGDVAPNR